MRSTVSKRILDQTPQDRKLFVRLNADIVVRVHELMQEKGFRQIDLAKAMGKTPSEVSKWLSGAHNLTLRSLVKLQEALGEPIIQVPKRTSLTKVNAS
ncbi:helix-turn-helix transcriptional regulator [Pontibacter sp. G13]|uniref:helix-turn-helix domain-containing protein n=1 Tax=Pontibacter sp. G13 TaxID=3074898 RepID=UPI0028898A31|nr:helix-turn-helix transcriptional regulator [Pontibacter sp. G13]WNJ16588.1 helix-turn-helix transcriptional regulator [Pontibacter sp. G13]